MYTIYRRLRRRLADDRLNPYVAGKTRGSKCGRISRPKQVGFCHMHAESIQFEDRHNLGGVYDSISSVTMMQHGAFLGPNRSSVIDSELLGRTSAALGHTAERCRPLTLGGLTCWPNSSRTTLAECLDLQVLSRSMLPTPGILTQPWSARIASISTVHGCVVGRFAAFLRNHVRGHGISCCSHAPEDIALRF